MLHQDHLLEDTMGSRPMIVRYRWWICYAVEGVIVLLWLTGLWLGRKSRFLWMAMAGLAFDMVIHLVLGFGLNEVYIMASHWAFVLPVGIAFLLKSPHLRPLASYLLLLLTTFLWLYNGVLLVGYLLG